MKAKLLTASGEKDLVTPLRITRIPGQPQEHTFPTLAVADAIKSVFGITNTSGGSPFKMESNPDYVIFPDINLWRGNLVKAYGEAGSVTRSQLNKRLIELGVEIG